MSLRSLLSRVKIDPYIGAIIGMVGVASVVPVHGEGLVVADYATKAAIALLFFLHGAKLSPQEAWQGARHWRLHGLVLLSTFVLFPLLGVMARAVAPDLLTPALWTGLILLCALPSTVQSSIAFTSIAGGNVSAALCAATGSNLLGMVLTPLLAALLLSTHGGFSMDSLLDIAAQLLLPFLAGQLSRPLISAWVSRWRMLLGLVDRGSILLIVYTAFSDGVTHGIWHQVDAIQLVTLVGVNAMLLAAVLFLTTLSSRALGFSRADEITIVFCGSKKSLASGLAMATVLLSGQPIGLIVMPLMLFHQIQLMTCAALARRYAARTPSVAGGHQASQFPDAAKIAAG